MSSMLVLGSVRFVLAFTAAPRLPVAAKPAPAAPVPATALFVPQVRPTVQLRGAACMQSIAAEHALPLLRHATFWGASTMLVRQVLPRVQQALPAPSTRLKRHLNSSHEQFEPLSVGCWTAHLGAQAMTSHVALNILLPSADSKLRVLGLALALSTFGGGFLLGSHALIGRDTFLEKALYAIGTRIVRTATLAKGVGILLPASYVPCFAVLLPLCITTRVTFSNRPGRLLSLLTLVTVAATKAFNWPYRVAYVAFALVLPFLPSSTRDDGHSIVAVSLSLPVAMLLAQ